MAREFQPITVLRSVARYTCGHYDEIAGLNQREIDYLSSLAFRFPSFQRFAESFKTFISDVRNEISRSTSSELRALSFVMLGCVLIVVGLVVLAAVMVKMKREKRK